MQLQLERRQQSNSVAGFQFVVRRISLAERMRFLASNHDLMQKLKFLGAAPDKTESQRLELAELELQLSRRMLELALAEAGIAPNLVATDCDQIDWLLHAAPAGLCVEALAVISEEISLSETRRKN